ncbi:MAG: hypothetical protein CL994_05490 [Euryarchaeota archaeon]|nr:hypothetical protein [Euryarchaeota archaeon]
MDLEEKKVRPSTMRTQENKYWRLEPMNPSKYEIKGAVVPLGAGLRKSGYVVIQDGHYKEFFETFEAAQQAAKTYEDNDSNKECCE